MYKVLRFVFSSFAGVLEEAEFYNITELIRMVKERIQDRDAKQNQVCRLINSFKVQTAISYFEEILYQRL